MLEKEVKKTYDFIVRYIINHGYAPTQKEIAANTTTSSHTVARHLKTLEQAGYISKTKKKSRALKLNNFKFVEK